MGQIQKTVEYMGRTVNVDLKITGRLIEMDLGVGPPYVPEGYSTHRIVFIDGFPMRVDIGSSSSDLKTIANVDAMNLYRFEEGAKLTVEQMEEVVMEGWRALLKLKPHLPKELQHSIIPSL